MFHIDILVLITSLCVSPIRREVLLCKSEIVNCIVENIHSDLDTTKELSPCLKKGEAYLTKGEDK
jgi:hypothetical protein